MGLLARLRSLVGNNPAAPEEVGPSDMSRAASKMKEVRGSNVSHGPAASGDGSAKRREQEREAEAAKTQMRQGGTGMSGM